MLVPFGRIVVLLDKIAVGRSRAYRNGWINIDKLIEELEKMKGEQNEEVHN